MKQSSARRSPRRFDKAHATTDGWLLETKLRPPRYQMELLERERLTVLAGRLLEVTLTLVRTPAGYGKTVLLGQWQQALLALGVTTIWLSLDADDSGASQFVALLAHAAAMHGADSRGLVQALRQDAPRSVSENIMSSLIRELARLPGPVVIFLDDYHLAGGPDADRLVASLVQQISADLHLVVATRTRPGFPLSALRTTGRLQELTEAELRFRNEEIAAFFGGGVTSEEAELLGAQTEGWAAALQLARLCIKDDRGVRQLVQRFCGSTSEIAGYMADQVLLQLPESTRDFLLLTSILEHVNGDLANAVCCREDCWRILDELDRLNALIFPIDTSRHWYRYHPLFAEYLRAELARRGEAEIARLHRRAAAWFMGKDRIVEAVRHLCKAGDTAEALRLLERSELIKRMLWEGTQVYSRIRHLFAPQELGEFPRVQLAQVLLLLKEGELEEGRMLLEDIKRRVTVGSRAVEGDRESIRREMLLMETFLGAYLDLGVVADSTAAMEAYAGSIDPADHWYRGILDNLICLMHLRRGSLVNARATAYASLEQYALAGMIHGTMFMNLHFGCIMLTYGSLLEASRSFRDANAIADRYFPYDQHLGSLCRVFVAEACYEQNRLEEASEHIFGSLQLMERGEGWVEAYVSGYGTAMGLVYANQGLMAVRRILEYGRRFTQKRKLKRLGWFLTMREISYHVLAGQHREARRLLEASKDALEDLRATFDDAQLWFELEELACTEARVLMAESRLAEAARLLRSVSESCEAKDHGRRLLQALILLATTLQRAGELDQASQVARRVLQMSRNEGFLRIFLDEGAQTEALLKAVVAHVGLAAFPSALIDWIAEILSAFAHSAAGEDKSFVQAVLTGREQEVLRRLCAGGSNKVIARELRLTDNAVKFHLKNIYRKLGVNDRRLAISVARVHGLLADPAGAGSGATAQLSVPG